MKIICFIEKSIYFAHLHYQIEFLLNTFPKKYVKQGKSLACLDAILLTKMHF